MSRLIAVIAVAVTSSFFWAACAGSQSATKPESRSVPQCLSLCSNQFASCTEEYPGDFSACRGDRADCERACHEQRALERMESNDGSEVIAPTDAEEDEFNDDGMEPTPELNSSDEGVE